MSGLSQVNVAENLVQAFADKNWAELWSLVDPRVLYHETPTNRRMRGIRMFMTIMREWEEAFPDSKFTIKSTKTLGNTAVVEMKWTGTQQGPIMTPGGVIQPTGKKIDIPASMVVEFGESETGIYEFGDLSPVELGSLQPKAEKISLSFDIDEMQKQIELTEKERAA